MKESHTYTEDLKSLQWKFLQWLHSSILSKVVSESTPCPLPLPPPPPAASWPSAVPAQVGAGREKQGHSPSPPPRAGCECQPIAGLNKQAGQREIVHPRNGSFKYLVSHWLERSQWNGRPTARHAGHRLNSCRRATAKAKKENKTREAEMALVGRLWCRSGVWASHRRTGNWRGPSTGAERAVSVCFSSTVPLG